MILPELVQNADDGGTYTYQNMKMSFARFVSERKKIIFSL